MCLIQSGLSDLKIGYFGCLAQNRVVCSVEHVIELTLQQLYGELVLRKFLVHISLLRLLRYDLSC